MHAVLLLCWVNHRGASCRRICNIEQEREHTNGAKSAIAHLLQVYNYTSPVNQTLVAQVCANNYYVELVVFQKDTTPPLVTGATSLDFNAEYWPGLASCSGLGSHTYVRYLGVVQQG